MGLDLDPKVIKNYLILNENKAHKLSKARQPLTT